MDDKNMDLQGFIDKLVSQKKEFEGLEPGVIKQIKSELLQRAEDRIQAVILGNMPEDQMAEFGTISEKGTDEEVQAFVESRIPDLKELIASELIVFQQTYLA